MIKFFGVFSFVLLTLAGCQKTSKDVANQNVEKGKQAFEVQDYSRSIQFFNDALNEEPADVEARLGLARAWQRKAYASPQIQLNDLDSAYSQVRFWKRAVELKSDRFLIDSISQTLFNKIHLGYAKQLFVTGAYEKTLQVLNQTIEITQDSKQYLEYLQLASFVYFSQSQDSLALDYGRRIIELYPDFEAAYLDVGKMYWQVEDYDEALVVWGVGQEKFPTNEELSYWFLEAMDKTGWLDD